MVRREKANYMIQSVSHAIDVLEALCNAGDEIGVTELSKILKLHKNNVFRLLATLELRGYVEQNPKTENYRLGVSAVRLGQSYILQSNLVARALPALRALSEKTGETVNLAVLKDLQVQFPISIESKRPVKVAPRVAVSLSAKQSAAGRLLTAQLPDEVLSEILSSNTPQDAAIKNQLSELRTRRLIVDRGAIEVDVVSICKVVTDSKGEPVGAVELLVPQYRADVDAQIAVVEAAAEAVSRAMGASKKAGLAGQLEREVSEEAALSMGVLAASSGKQEKRKASVV